MILLWVYCVSPTHLYTVDMITICTSKDLLFINSGGYEYSWIK